MLENGKKQGSCYIVQADVQMSVTDFINNELQVPKKLLHSFRMSKLFTINGVEFYKQQMINVGDEIAIPLFLEEEITPSPIESSINVLYEDDHYLVLNKASNMNVHKSHEGEEVTLDEAVAAYFAQNHIKSKVRHIHRLDKDTTGAILYAKHHLAGALMDKLLTEGKVKRQYCAVVHGKVQKKKGVIEAPIGKDRHNSKRRQVTRQGDYAKTCYSVLHYEEKRNVSVVTIRLETGRTHQIRVHMSYIGHPLVGDTLYGGKVLGSNRQALHGESLSFFHPFLKCPITVTAPLPDDMKIYR